MNKEDNEYFKVEGAGFVEIGKGASAVTAQTGGFHFSVSWGSHGYAGGVMSRTEASRLAEHILKILEQCSDTEEECVVKAYQRLDFK